MSHFSFKGQTKTEIEENVRQKFLEGNSEKNIPLQEGNQFDKKVNNVIGR